MNLKVEARLKERLKFQKLNLRYIVCKPLLGSCLNYLSLEELNSYCWSLQEQTLSNIPQNLVKEHKELQPKRQPRKTGT
jgi:hypothetical protein